MQLQALILQLQTLLKNLSPAKRFTLLLLVAATVTGFIFLMTWTAKPDYQLLYSNLAAEDAGEIVSRLREKKIPYQIAANGSSVLVPREQIYETRMELASQGLPQGSGVGFEIFDNTKLGMTEFVQNVNYQRALQGELARTINRFSEIENARVHIVMASQSLFAEREKPATASVVLKLRAGKWLDDTQIQGIIHLLSSSVAGLQPQNVTIVDNSGKMLAGFKDKSALGKISSDQFEFQEKIERGLENRIKTMLESALGPSRAIVRIACLLDFKRLEKTEERFDPENRVVRSEQLSNENGTGMDTLPIGVPGPIASMNIKEPAAGKNQNQPGVSAAGPYGELRGRQGDQPRC